MRLPQFSLKALAGAVAFAAAACCSLAYASSTWSSTIYTAAIVFLAFSTLAAVYSYERTRAYWVGCAFCGWLYLLLVFGPLSGTQQVNTMGQLNVESELATTHLARWLYGTVLPKLRTPPRVMKTVAVDFTMSPFLTAAEVELNGMASGGTSGAVMKLKVDPTVPVAAGTPLAAVPSSVSTPHYPDETSFIRVSHALWTWLFALAGGVVGSWLYGPRALGEQVPSKEKECRSQQA